MSRAAKTPGGPAIHQRQHPTGMSWITMGLLITTAVASLRGSATMSVYGLASIFLYLLPAVVFLIPTALISAELASGWKGGVFVWVKEAFGDQLGFFAIWQQWMQNVVWYPAQLAFGAAALAYIVNPGLASSGLFTAIVILVVYWGATLMTCRGLNIATFVGSKGLLVGTLLPAALLIILALIWIVSGRPVAMPLRASALLPQWTGIASIVLIISNFLQYAGMEMNAVHVNELDDPKRGFPRAIALASVLILLIFIPPVLSIAVGVPAEKISLTGGVLQAFETFFSSFGLAWLTPVLGLLIAIGVLASVITWIAGPSRGLLLVGDQGYLPPWFHYTNKAGIQEHILLVQGGIVTVLALLFAIVPGVNAIFWALSAIATQLYLLMYMLMFLAAMRLRRTHASIARGYRAPALFFWASVGFVASVLAFLIGFVPPAQASSIPASLYALGLIVGILLLGCGPFIFYALRQTSWGEKEPTTV
ncbi:MAG TPA: APC family permease [Ktedonosporobacter sp.]|nr:APC family permease [Ktedonosporobacter sp.]